MQRPPTTVDKIAKCPTLIDYVQFRKWTKTACFSKEDQFQVSASYAMGIIFNHWKGGYKERYGYELKLVDIAPSFFCTGDKARQGCYNYRHGIVYEGCWVTYDDKIMSGSSKRNLPVGKSFAVLYLDEVFRTWFTKVLDGFYGEYDFDTLPLDILTSLTSPNSPGSLASDNPAGSSPSVGLSIPNNQVAAPAQQDADASTSVASTKSPRILAIEKATEPREARLSIATAKEKKAAPVQDGSQAAGHVAVKPLAATQPSDKASTSMKRKNASPSTSSSDKRTKTDSAYQRQEIIDISSGDEEHVKLDPDDSQSSSNTTQNQKLMKENAALKLSESRAVNRANEALDKIEQLMQGRSLKLSEMRAVNRANEALGKLRAANRANEELGGNDDFMGQIEQLMRENARLKLSALRPVDRAGETIDNDEGRTGRIKDERTAVQIKKEEFTRQRGE